MAFYSALLRFVGIAPHSERLLPGPTIEQAPFIQPYRGEVLRQEMSRSRRRISMPAMEFLEEDDEECSSSGSVRGVGDGKRRPSKIQQYHSGF